MAVLYGVVTYILPCDTIGVFSNEPSLEMPVWNIIRGISCPTFGVLIVLRVESRWFQSLPPYVVHSPLWAATWLAATRSIGAIHQRVLMAMDTLPFSVTFSAETGRSGPWKIEGSSPPIRFPVPDRRAGHRTADSARGVGARAPWRAGA